MIVAKIDEESKSLDDDKNEEPEPLLEIAYFSDFKVQLVRHVSNILIVSSKEGAFTLQISL